MSHAVMVTAVASFTGIAALALSTAIIASVNWRPVLEQLAGLAVMLALLYWTTTLLPGPVRKVGRTVGRGVMKAARGKRDKR